MATPSARAGCASLDAQYRVRRAQVRDVDFRTTELRAVDTEDIGARDYPLAQGAITVFTMIIIVVNLVVDMLYAVVDPRVTYR